MRAGCGSYHGVSPMLRKSSMQRSQRFQRGVTLIEVLVGVTVGLIILAGAVTVITNLSFSGLENTRAIRLNHQLRSTLDLIHRDLQRAGYVYIWDETVLTSWDDADTDVIERSLGVAGVINFGGTATDVDGDGYQEFSCITFTYDANDDGVVDADEDGVYDQTDEIFGYRFNGGAVEVGTNVTCANNTNWNDITDAGITITALSFEREEFDSAANTGDSQLFEVKEDGVVEAGCGAGDTCLDRRIIHVVLEGQLATDTSVTVALRDEVKIKNDHYFRFDDLP